MKTKYDIVDYIIQKVMLWPLNLFQLIKNKFLRWTLVLPMFFILMINVGVTAPLLIPVFLIYILNNIVNN